MLPKAQFQSVTLLDVQLARVYLPYLMALARERRTCTYTELVDLAKLDHPGRPEVQKAIAVSTGRRLDVIKHYCEDEGLPVRHLEETGSSAKDPQGTSDATHLPALQASPSALSR